jgi:hypothetical protein
MQKLPMDEALESLRLVSDVLPMAPGIRPAVALTVQVLRVMRCQLDYAPTVIEKCLDVYSHCGKTVGKLKIFTR